MRPAQVVLLLGLAIAIAGYQDAREIRAPGPGAEAPAPVHLPPAWLARAASLGHETLAADYFWIQALQYYGNWSNRTVYYVDLHRFLDLTVSLDPDFLPAYRFGAAIIPYNRGSWTWENVDESTDLLLRGLARFPDDYMMWMQLGFNRGIIGDDPLGAAEAYRHAAALPSAPPWISSLVVRLQATSGSLDRARAYTRTLLAQATDPDERASLERRLLEIRTEELLQGLDEAVSEYEHRFDEPPPSLQALVDRGVLDRLPPDPLGGRFELQDGRPVSPALRGQRLEPLGRPR